MALLATATVSRAALPVSGQTIEFAGGSSEGGTARGGQPKAQMGNVVDTLLYKQTAKLIAFDAVNGDEFGRSVSISGDIVVVGAIGNDGTGSNQGAAYIFARNEDGADSWGLVTKLTALDAEDYDVFGISVSISGDTAVVGASGEDGAGSMRGAAYVFERNQGGADNWGQVVKLTASDAADGDVFGISVAISGDAVVVGAYMKDGAGSMRGAVYLFERNQGGVDNWGQVTKLTALDAEDYDYFGASVAISGDTVVVGAYRENGSCGAAYIFERNQGGVDNWGQVVKLVASDAANDDFFGYSVTTNGDMVVVGAFMEDGAGSMSGAAYVFERNQGGADNWGQVVKLMASDAVYSDCFGYSVAISGYTVVVGANWEDGTGSMRGAAYVFERNQGGADNWGQVVKLTASDAADYDCFGHSVAINGRGDVVVGAYREDGLGRDRGAAYLFVLRPFNIYLPLLEVRKRE